MVFTFQKLNRDKNYPLYSWKEVVEVIVCGSNHTFVYMYSVNVVCAFASYQFSHCLNGKKNSKVSRVINEREQNKTK